MIIPPVEIKIVTKCAKRDQPGQLLFLFRGGLTLFLGSQYDAGHQVRLHEFGEAFPKILDTHRFASKETTPLRPHDGGQDHFAPDNDEQYPLEHLQKRHPKPFG